MNDNILYFDIESSDLPIHTARIITISFIYNGEEKTLYINPGVPIKKEASFVNGIYDKDVKDWKPFSYYAPQIIKLLKKCEAYAGYNCRKFDIPLLSIELLRCGYEMPNKPIFDIYEMVQGLFKSLKLKDIYTVLTGEIFNAHKSSEDIRATQKLYYYLRTNFYER